MQTPKLLNARRHRTGIAIPVVLIFAMIMAVFGLFIAKTNQQQYRQEMTAHHQLQAHFIARAGMEHALLKARYLHRELYDAAAMAQYRNPLFNFAAGISSFNPGPVFLYHSGEGTPTGFFTPSVTFSTAPTTSPDAWLQTFIADVQSDTGITNGGTVNAMLSMNPFPANIRSKIRDPFQAQYAVTKIDVLAKQIDTTAGAANHEIVEITVRGQVNLLLPDGTPRLNLDTGLPAEWTEELRKVVSVTRQ